MAIGVSTTDLPLSSVLDEVIGDADPGTGLQTVRCSATNFIAQVQAQVNLASTALGVKSRALSTPPGSPATNDRYIVGPSPTGAWAGKANQIAVWNGSAWSFTVPSDGNLVIVSDEFVLYAYKASSALWQAVTSAPLAFDTYAHLAAVTGAPANVGATVYSDVVALTASRARSANVATIVFATNHGLSNGNKVNIRNVGGTGYNADQVTVTVVNATTITYSNTGGNETTAADTGGQADRNGVYASNGAGGWTWVGDPIIDPGISAALAAKANIASPTFTGSPAAPTPAQGDNSTLVATTAFVADAKVALTEHAGASTAALTTQTGGTTVPVASVAAGTQVWGCGEQFHTDGFIRSISARFSATGAGFWAVFDASGMLLAEYAATVSSTGVNTFAFGETIPAPAGGYLFWRPTSGAALNYDTSGFTPAIAVGSYPAIGSRVTPTIVANVRMAIQYTLEYAANGSINANASEAVARSRWDAQGETREIRTSQPSTFTWPAGSPAMPKISVGYDAGQDIYVGQLITGVVAEITADATVHHFIIKVYSRPTASASIESAPPVADDTLLQTVYALPADLGVTPGASTTVLASVALRPIMAQAATSYFVTVESWNASGALVNMGVGGVAGTESRQRRRGWYGNANSMIGAGFMVTLGFKVQRYTPVALADEAYLDRVDYSSCSYSAFGVTTTATIDRNGAPFMAADSRTLTAAATGNVRYDTLYFDPELRVFGVASGGETATDAAERLAVLSSSKYQPLFNLRVTDTAITDAVPLWRIDRNKDAHDIYSWLESERRRSRGCLPKTLAKIRKGSAIKIGVIGDSIAAMQYSTITEDINSPNGPNRDRAAQGYLNSGNIGADLLAAIPLYTSVGLNVGRADDGAGAVHTKVGWLWELVLALQATGLTVAYDNFAVGGYATANAMSAGVPGAWVTNAIALGWDVAFLHFGKNEEGNTSTESNLVAIANAFLAAGIEVVMMGVTRSHAITAAQKQNWEYTQRAVGRAARYAGAAHVPTGALFDDRYIGAVGISPLDTSVTNQLNHPGLMELKRVGAELKKLFF